MASNRSPDIKYNGSGYKDLTARDAICKADKDLLRKRRKSVMDKLRRVAQSEGFDIYGEFELVERKRGGENV